MSSFDFLFLVFFLFFSPSRFVGVHLLTASTNMSLGSLITTKGCQDHKGKESRELEYTMPRQGATHA